ncbi:DUF6541 family protein [Trueperella pecoris]|uniref:Uncharacterized protein n=1 Tax=Trueperella pecoris TaxID=2733571 RepID=A0A7M1QTN0_9ACTO|nr:DUF6541 family protein [Trueperella pecoris]QOR45203.1 hypothetical protein INS88_07935 [Trueperella pecoris]
MSLWLAEIPRFAAILAVFYIPGFILAQIVHRQTLILRVAIAPAWSAGAVGLLSLLYGILGVAWTPWSALIGYAVLLGFVFTATMLVRRRLGAVVSIPYEPGHKPVQSPPSLWQLALPALIFGLIAALPILRTVPPNGLIQGGDSQFHIGLLWKMIGDGLASPLMASAGMMGLNPSPGFYPTAWHALLATVTPQASQALVTANVMLIVAPVLWIFSIMSLTWALTKDRAATWWALAASGLVPMALIRLELITTLWPFVVGMALMPGVLAVAVREAPTITPLWKRSRLGAVAMVALRTIPALGLLVFHPSTFLPVAVAVWLWALIYSARHMWKEWRHEGCDRYRLGAWGGAVFFLIAMPQLVYTSAYASLFQLHRLPQVSFSGLPTKLIATATMYSPGGGLENFVFYIAVFIVTSFAALTVWRTRRYRLLVIAWGAQVLVVLACYIPMPIFNRLTSLYYNVPTRGLVGEAVFLVPMVAVAATTWMKWLSRKRRVLHTTTVSLGASALVFVALTSVSYRANAQASYEMVYPTSRGVRFLASAPEIALIKRAAQLPADSYILGDPAAGASLIEIASNRRVVWPYPGLEQGQDDKYLAERFNQIHYNPRVCEIVRQYGITHFYKDRPGWYNSSYTAARRPGLYQVDTEKGFTFVDRGGTAAIYSIDMCYDPTWKPEKWPAPASARYEALPGQPSIW